MIESHDLQNRGPDPKGSAEAQAAIRRVKGKPETDPPTLAERVAAAKDLRPTTGPDLHCGHCWATGRDAAVRAIERETPP